MLREVNITKFEKDPPETSSTSFPRTSFEKEIKVKSETSCNEQHTSFQSGTNGGNDVTDLTVTGKSTTSPPGSKPRSRKGQL